MNLKKKKKNNIESKVGLKRNSKMYQFSKMLYRLINFNWGLILIKWETTMWIKPHKRFMVKCKWCIFFYWFQNTQTQSMSAKKKKATHWLRFRAARFQSVDREGLFAPKWNAVFFITKIVWQRFACYKF